MKEDINTNNLIFAKDVLRFIPLISNSPMVPNYFGEILQQNQDFIEMTQFTAVGCSNDERYNEEWKAENYIMVTLLSVIGTHMYICC